MKTYFLLTCVAVSLLGACRSLPPVQTIENRTVTPVGITLQEAILAGGAKKGWGMYEMRPGLIRGELVVRGHEVKVDIPYASNTYSIYYADSVGMKYKAKKRRIHRKYNQWVRNLDLAIRQAAAGDVRK